MKYAFGFDGKFAERRKCKINMNVGVSADSWEYFRLSVLTDAG